MESVTHPGPQPIDVEGGFGVNRKGEPRGKNHSPNPSILIAGDSRNQYML